MVILIGFTESARLDPANRLVPSVIARNYLKVLRHPLCLGYILINAAAFGALFAYVSVPDSDPPDKRHRRHPSGSAGTIFERYCRGTIRIGRKFGRAVQKSPKHSSVSTTALVRNVMLPSSAWRSAR